MSEDRSTSVDPRTLGARIRAAREAKGWTHQQLENRLSVAQLNLMAVEAGEQHVRPEDLMEIASVLGCRMWELLKGDFFVERLGLEQIPEHEPLPPHYVALAIEAWQREGLTEGQLARILRTNRIGARDAVLRFQAAEASSNDGGESLGV